VSADPKAAHDQRFKQWCDELTALSEQLRELGGKVDFPDRPILLFKIDADATARDGFTVYEPTETYLELCAAFRRKIDDLKQSGGGA
jgi:hypothetical protein